MASSARPIALKSPAIVRWICADGEAKHLGLRDPEPACKVVADVRFQPGERTALFRLRVPVLLETPARATNVFMFIYPQHVLQLGMINGRDDASTHIPETVQHGFITSGTCACAQDIAALRFTVKRGSTVAVPKESSLKPRRDSSATLLELLSSLSQCKSFTIYYPRNRHLTESLESLCTAASAGHLAPILDEYSLERLYHGKGARIAEQSRPAETNVDSPPSYDEIGPSPPPEPSKRTLRANSPPSRPGPAKRARTADSTWRSSVETQLQTILAQLAELQDSARPPPSSQPTDPDAESPPPSGATTDAKIDELRREVELIRQSLDERAAGLRGEFAAMLDAFRDEMVELVDTRDAELKEEIEEAKNEMAGATSEQIEDNLLDVKCDMQEFVDEHLKQSLEDVADRFKEKIKEASIFIDFGDDDIN